MIDCSKCKWHDKIMQSTQYRCRQINANVKGDKSKVHNEFFWPIKFNPDDVQECDSFTKIDKE